MLPGIIPFSRASLTLDLIALVMVGTVPLLLYSIYLVRSKKNYRLHRRIQLILAAVLLIVVCLFELDIRLYGWRHLAEDSAYYESWVFPLLYLHLVIAVSTTLIWAYTLITALRRFANPPVPNSFSPHHKWIARLAAGGMICTAISGWAFYLVAFVA